MRLAIIAAIAIVLSACATAGKAKGLYRQVGTETETSVSITTGGDGVTRTNTTTKTTYRSPIMSGVKAGINAATKAAP